MICFEARWNMEQYVWYGYGMRGIWLPPRGGRDTITAIGSHARRHLDAGICFGTTRDATDVARATYVNNTVDCLEPDRKWALFSHWLSCDLVQTINTSFG
jgi:hypothetical protein